MFVQSHTHFGMQMLAVNNCERSEHNQIEATDSLSVSYKPSPAPVKSFT